MTFNVSIPAAVPRTLIRTPQLNPILAMFRDAQSGDVLQGFGSGIVDFRPLGSLGPSTLVDVTLTPTAGAGGWQLRTAGSATTYPGSTATYEGPRSALLWLNDTNESDNESAALVIDMREDQAANPTARTGLHVKAWARPDRGESSGILAIQTGGGSSVTTYKTHRMRPDGKPNLSYAAQGALEVGSDDMGFAAIIQSGGSFGVSAGNPDPTLTAGINAAVTTIPVSDLAKFPPPGAATIYPDGGYPTWPTPLYVKITTAGATETISYTGRSAATGAGNLTGCVRGVNPTTGPAAAHNSGDSVVYVNANHALMIRMAEHISKGLLIAPSEAAGFDNRPAIQVATPVHGSPTDTSVKVLVRMNGNIETVGDYLGRAGTFTSTLAATTSVSTAQVNCASASVTGTATIGTVSATTGTFSGAVSGTTGTFSGAVSATTQVSTAQVNATDLSVTASSTLAGPQRLTGIVSPPQITANQDNYAPTGLATARVLKLSTDATRTITGIVAQPNGHLLLIVNVGSQPLAFTHEAATSAAGNRMLLAAGVTVTLQPQGVLELWYDGGGARWRGINGAG